MCVNVTGQIPNPVILSMGNACARMVSLATSVPKVSFSNKDFFLNFFVSQTVQKVNGDLDASINAAAVVIHAII